MLTAREVELLRLLAAGLMQKQAAYQMGIAPKTAQTMSRNIRQKLQADTTAQAVAIVQRKFF